MDLRRLAIAFDQIHNQRLEHIRQGELLSQRFQDLRNPYFALPAKKFAQDPEFRHHVASCIQELSRQPTSRLSDDFLYVQQMWANVLFALESQNLSAAQLQMRAVEYRTVEMKKRLDAVGSSLEVLEMYDGDNGVGQKLRHLQFRVEQLDIHYHQLHSQWNSINLLIRDCASVSLDSLLASVTAFNAMPQGLTTLERKRQFLEESITEVAKMIADRNFEGAEALVASAEALCEKLENFLNYLDRGVQEYQAAELRGTVPSDRTVTLGPTSTINIHIANTGPKVGRHSRFNMMVDYHLHEHDPDTPVLPGIGVIPEWMHRRRYFHAPPTGKPPQNTVQSSVASSDAITNKSTSTDEDAPGTNHRRRCQLPATLGYPQAVSPQTRAEMKRIRNYGPARTNAEEADETKVDSAVTSEFPVDATPLKLEPSEEAK